jgi:hypothetical protein
MKRLRWLVLAALFAGLAAPAAGQVVDTVFVPVVGTLTSVTITEYPASMRAGDTVQFVAVAIDEEGDSYPAVYTWASSDSTVIRIDAETGLAVGLRKSDPGTPVAITVRAEGVVTAHLASFRPPDSLNWSGHDTLVMERDAAGNPLPVTLQYCAWFIDAEGYVVAESPGFPTCPRVFPHRPTEPGSMFAGVSRSRSFGAMAGLLAAIR